MASSSSRVPVGPPLQPNTGEGLETPPVVPAASTEAMVDASSGSSARSRRITPAAPSSVSGEAEDLREGFAFPLIDPWYASSPLFPPRSVDFSFPMEDWDWTVSGLEPTSPINFDFLCAASKDWSHWVDREILDPDFWDSLLDAGVHWSILISRSCNMFRDTESLRELLRRWCPSTHTFFFSWGELTPTLEDVANHWMLPILGEHSLSDIKLSAEEEEIAAALRKQSSTRLSGWPSHFIQHKGMFQSAGLLLCYTGFTFFWEHSVSYLFAAKDKSAAWGRFSDLPREFLDHFPDFRDNLPLVYRWVGLKTRDYDLVDALDHEENVLFRPYGDDHPGFTCASVFRKFYQPSPLIRDLKVDDYRTLSYLSTVNPGFLPTLSAAGVSFIPYCPQRVQRQFGLDQVVHLPVGEVRPTRVMIPGGHRLGFNTPSMGAYWQRFTQSMVEFVIAGRSDKTPMSVHRKPLVSNPYLTPSSQSAISYANSQKLGFAKWDGVRGGWIAYTIHLPEGWRNSVNVVEDRLIMLSKRGKWGKREAPVDLAVEKTSKKPTPSFLLRSQARKSVASRPPKGQKKTSVSSSSPDEEQPSTVSTPSPSKKKKFVAPLFPLGAAGRTRSRSGSKVTHGSGRSGGGVVVVEDSDVADDDVIASPLRKDAPQTAAVDQDEDLRKSAADSSEVGAESTGEDHSSSSGSFFDSTPGSVPEEQIMSAGSTADDDDMPEADDSSMEPADPMEGDLAIVPHAGHGHDDDSTVDADIDPISFSVPQTVLSSRVTGSDVSMAYIMEGISLFGTTPSFRAIPAGGFVISASRIAGETPPVAGGALIPEETHAQGLVESESVVDLGVSTADHDVPIEDADHRLHDMEIVDLVVMVSKISVPDCIDLAWMIPYVCRKMLVKWELPGEITAVSPPPRPTVEAGSSVGVGSLSSEVADFLKEFDRKVPNPHPEQFFWRFNGTFGALWQFLGSKRLLALFVAVILAWRSVIQDLMEVGFDLGFLIERLRQTAQYFFGKRISDEDGSTQDTRLPFYKTPLAALTAYQDEMVSTGRMILRTEHGGSFLDSLLD
uniref:Aminotransferase-like plant mobile domain-containing protein n=1 Tax=Fagus sylvatica TaxID=28930 RepID=A0A2N9GEM6_FAGSY